MLTQFFLNINWVDVALAVLLVRTIFLSVQTGFVAEAFRFFGTLLAVFICLHYYHGIAEAIDGKIHLSPNILQLIVFVLLWIIIIVAIKFLKDGALMLFKVETTHKGFDQYGAGFLGVGRGLLICSLTIFVILLIHNPRLSRMTFKSYSYQITGMAAPRAYGFMYNQIIGKIFSGERYNKAIEEVIYPEHKK
jgi:uncharacterized membrane protein required for colicin V production